MPFRLPVVREIPPRYVTDLQIGRSQAEQDANEVFGCHYTHIEPFLEHSHHSNIRKPSNVGCGRKCALKLKKKTI